MTCYLCGRWRFLGAGIMTLFGRQLVTCPNAQKSHCCLPVCWCEWQIVSPKSQQPSRRGAWSTASTSIGSIPLSSYPVDDVSCLHPAQGTHGKLVALRGYTLPPGTCAKGGCIELRGEDRTASSSIDLETFRSKGRAPKLVFGPQAL